MFFITNINKIKQFFTRILYGIIIGASMMIPGLSGGTAAILLGVFYEIMYHVNSFVKNTLKSLKYLLPYALGGVIGLILSCYPLRYIINNYEIFFIYFIIGIIFGSVKNFCRKIKCNIKSILLVVFGIVLVLLQTLLKQTYIDNDKNILFLIFIGLLSAIALILPGISFTNILITFGYYDVFVESIIDLDVLFLLVFGASLLCGIIGFSGIIMKLYNKSPNNTNLVLSGLMLGSIIEIHTKFPNPNDIFECILLLIGGFCCSLIFTAIEK